MSKYGEASAKWVGKGSFGDVETIVRSWDQKTVIRKTVRFDPDDVTALRNAKNEYRSQRYLDHPNIARYIDVEWSDSQVRYYMDYFENGSLNTLIGKGSKSKPRAKTDNKVPQEQVWAIMYQLSAAVAYCHDPEKKLRDVEEDESEGPGMMPAQVLHRDIKPHNVLRATEAENYLEELKLCDFGMAFILEGTNKPQTYAGTKAYKPPEISRANEGGIEWTTKCDIYSLGCTLYEICNGEPPFPKGSPDSESEAKRSTIQSYYDDSDLRSWIQRCLSFRASQRPEAQEIRDAARDKLKDIPKYERALGYQSLLEAVEEGSVKKVEEQLSHLQMTDLQDGRSHTPLHRAVQYRRVDVVNKLLERGFSALARTKNHETPIHLALELMEESKSRKLNFERKLSESKDEISESKEKLMSLCDILNLDEYMSAQLVGSCDILRDEPYPLQRWPPLHLAAAANSIDIVKYTLQPNPGWRDSSQGPRYSLVHIAARMGHLDLLKFLIEREKGRQEAVVEQKSGDEATPLFAASKRGQADAVQLLLSKGANINVLASNIKIRAEESRCDVTALHIAALGGHTETVEVLCEDKKRNKVIKAKTDQGETALHLAVQNNHQSCQGVIGALVGIINIEEMAVFRVSNITKKRTALHVAVENGNIKGTLKLLECGAKPNAKTKDLDTALHLAARKGLKAIAEALLNRGAQAGEWNHARATPLHEAIEHSMHEDDQGKPTLDKAVTETAEMLIRHDPKLVSQEARLGDVALHLAAKVGNLTLFKAAYGRAPALVNARRNDKETALHVAARADRYRIVEFLLDSGADWNLKDERGRRALEVATGKSEALLEKCG